MSTQVKTVSNVAIKNTNGLWYLGTIQVSKDSVEPFSRDTEYYKNDTHLRKSYPDALPFHSAVNGTKIYHSTLPETKEGF